MPPRRYLTHLVLVPLIALAALWLFAWPAARVAPRALPLGVSGPDGAVVHLEGRLAVTHGSTSFDLRRYHDEQSARRAVEHRDVYGAVVLDRAGTTTLLTAPAASPTVAALLQQAVAAPDAAAARPVQVIDVAPLPATDPRGMAFTSSLLPLLVAGIASGAIASRLARTARQRVGVLVGAAALTGPAATALAQSWLGYLGGDWAANAGVIALTVLAVSSVVTGLAALGRTTGLVFGAVLMVLLGNATSGASTAPELLPTGIGWTGRLLPPGAGSSALRGTAFFHGYGIGGDLAVLSVWSVLGCVMVGLGVHRTRQHPHGAHGPGATTGSAPGEALLTATVPGR
jgi:hypothetical protein